MQEISGSQEPNSLQIHLQLTPTPKILRVRDQEVAVSIRVSYRLLGCFTHDASTTVWLPKEDANKCSCSRHANVEGRSPIGPHL